MRKAAIAFNSSSRPGSRGLKTQILRYSVLGEPEKPLSCLRLWSMILLSFFFLQVSAGRVYDSVLVAAEGINRAIESGVDLSLHPVYSGFCRDWDEQPENSNGKEIARHLNEVS